MARLERLDVADPPALWADLGFAVDGGAARVGGVEIRLGAPGAGVVGWGVAGLEAGGGIDGLPAPRGAALPGSDPHPNGAIAVDHLVAVTDDLDRTAEALLAAGLAPRRVREAGGLRQAFYVLETALLELAGPVEGARGARLWGLTVAVADLDALAARLGERLGEVRDAVQPGRRIATLRREAGSTVPLAFMSPRG